jgi:hypothetical protein
MRLLAIIAAGMLKIGTVKWRGAARVIPCLTPKWTDQAQSGAAIHGVRNSRRFSKVRQRTLGLTRTFAPSSSAQRRKPADPDAERQQDLFGPLRDPCSAPIY